MLPADQWILERDLALGATTDHHLWSVEVQLLEQKSQSKACQTISKKGLLIIAVWGHRVYGHRGFPQPQRARRPARIYGSVSAMRERVQSVVDDIIRPLVEADGGTIELVEVASESVTIRLGGAYAGCPSGPFTLRGIIEPAIRKATGRPTRVELLPALPAARPG